MGAQLFREATGAGLTALQAARLTQLAGPGPSRLGDPLPRMGRRPSAGTGDEGLATSGLDGEPVDDEDFTGAAEDDDAGHGPRAQGSRSEPVETIELMRKRLELTAQALQLGARKPGSALDILAASSGHAEGGGSSSLSYGHLRGVAARQLTLQDPERSRKVIAAQRRLLA